VAEIGAAYLSGITGIERETLDNSAAYIKGWLGRLKNDNKLFVMASAYAQHAVDYILENQRSKFNPAAVLAENTDDVETETIGV
jgi:antirestriction protein ArdC